MNTLILYLYKYLSPNKKKRKLRSKGFTLLELLISLVIAGMVMSGLLYVVVELTKLDKREASLDQVQRDMKRAMDYIVGDLQEAVYVYTDPTIIADQLETDSDFPQGTSVVPVLAFWRVDPIEGTDINRLKDNCNDYPTDEKDRICEVLKIRQASYTLVVYLQKVREASDKKWIGQSRVIRYELPRYSASGLETLDENSGYRDPTKQNDPNAVFEDWKVDNIITPATATTPAVLGPPEVPSGNAAVLVDFVKSPVTSTPPVELDRPPLSHTDSDGNDAPCYGYGSVMVDNDSNDTTPEISVPLYNVVPATATKTSNNTFFACVRNPDPADNTAANSNQDVYVFLRGSIQGASGGINSFSNESSLPILETQVFVRGVVDKNIQ